jgi:hypothetical protein
MRKLTLLAMLILVPFVASAQWEFDAYFPPDTALWDSEITDVHGLVVDKDGKIWVQPFYASETIITSNTNDTLSTRAIYVFNEDGTQTDFSPIITLKDVDGNEVDTLGRDWTGDAWEAMSGRGMRIDDDGNILVMQFNVLYRLRASDGAMLNSTVTPGGSKAAPAADLSGNVYIASVVGGNDILKYPKDFNADSTPETVVTGAPGFSRSFEVSGDGANIYWNGYTLGYVLVYNQPDEFSPFGTPDTVARGVKSESFTFNPATGQLWLSAGSFNDVPEAPWNPNTWYAFNTEDMNTPVDSLKWFSSFTAPGDDRASTFDESRPRALGFTADGLTAYIGAFNHSPFLTDASGAPVATPAVQKIVDRTDRTKRVNFTWNYDMLFPSDTTAQFSSTHGIAVDGNGKVWVQPFGATEDITLADGTQTTTRALYVFNEDGTQVDFSPITIFSYGDGEVDTVGHYWNGSAWEGMSGRGLQSDDDGNIIVSTGGIIYRISKEGQGLNKFFYRGSDGNLDSPTAAAVDGEGNVYVAPVVGGANNLIKLPKDFNPSTTPEVILAETPGFSRTFEISPDGNTIYWGGFTNTGVYVYTRADEFSSFDPASFTELTGLKSESMEFQPVTGYIWMSAGSSNDAPSNGYAPNTWYGFDPSDLNNPLESLAWNEAAKGVADGRPRAIAFSADGGTAYVGNFNESAPSAQKFSGKTATSVDDAVSQLPTNFKLEQNYPNPFNPTTAINFTLPAAGNTVLEVFDIQGRLVSTLVNREMFAGQHSVNFDASNLSSGVYIYRLRAGDFSLTRKMTLIK